MYNGYLKKLDLIGPDTIPSSPEFKEIANKFLTGLPRRKRCAAIIFSNQFTLQDAARYQEIHT